MNLVSIAARVEDPTGNGRVGFEVTTEDLYPNAVGDLLEAVQFGRAPESLALQALYRAAQAIQDPVWAWALVKRTDLNEAQRAQRAVVLELARLWFTELLHESVGQVPMYLRIRKAGEFDWRL